MIHPRVVLVKMMMKMTMKMVILIRRSLLRLNDSLPKRSSLILPRRSKSSFYENCKSLAAAAITASTSFLRRRMIISESFMG